MKTREEIINDIDREIIEEMKRVECCEYRNDKSFNNLSWIHNEDTTSEFRWVVLNDLLQISRVQFINKRVGLMTKCFNIILEHKEELGIKYVVIQSAFTDEMKSWCLKNRFQPASYSVDSDGNLQPICDFRYEIVTS